MSDSGPENRLLPARLDADGTTATVAVFPDGSVDAFYDVYVDGERVDTREAFADAVAAGRSDVFALERTATEPGGHAVNLATQAHALGGRVALAGHLDDPIFENLRFPAVSMGDPASVDVYEFEDGDVLAVENSMDLVDWALADLSTALRDESREAPVDALGGPEAFLGADVVCCVNWTSVPGLPGALMALAETEPGAEWLLVDPDAVGGRSVAEIDRFADALGRLGATTEVVLSANPDEVTALATTLDRDDSGDLRGEESRAAVERALCAFRDRTGVAATVVHGEERAAVATTERVVTVPNFDVEPTRNTGGGDRFDAGLAHALARDWPWRDALRLGNACASRYVETGETGTATEVAAFLRNRS